MDLKNYGELMTAEMLMGPNSAVILEEMLRTHPLCLTDRDIVLDLGCGKGLTSLILARETGAKIYANDLWISAEENAERFAAWGIAENTFPYREDANGMHFENKQFRALVSVDAYHYFATGCGFFAESRFGLISTFVSGESSSERCSAEKCASTAFCTTASS